MAGGDAAPTGSGEDAEDDQANGEARVAALAFVGDHSVVGSARAENKSASAPWPRRVVVAPSGSSLSVPRSPMADRRYRDRRSSARRSWLARHVSKRVPPRRWC